jgi:hypothetical protein
MEFSNKERMRAYKASQIARFETNDIYFFQNRKKKIHSVVKKA